MLTRLLLIALGGAIGSVARYGTGLMLRDVTVRSGFPWGTAAVNMIGCFVIGLLFGLWGERWMTRESHFLFAVGVLGGFTTFSSYGLETANLLREGHVMRAVMYLLVSNVVGIAAVMAGIALWRR